MGVTMVVRFVSAWWCCWVYVCFCVVVVAAGRMSKYEYDNEYESDRVERLPGQPRVGFRQYSGYVDVDAQDGRALFYWLTEAQADPLAKPLVLWLNGGPGCSSIAYGASEEIGPFRINKSASALYINHFSWNKLANLLFLETPAGVGFSYTNTSTNLKDTGDTRTAEDSLAFLVRWFHRFPHYKHRDFYITGESYAGHYVPQLAMKIYDYNKKHPDHLINLKGFMVGNAVTDNYYDNLGTVNYWWSHSMISDQTYRDILKHCNFTQQETSSKCNDLLTYATDHEFGNIDQYSIYTIPCPKALVNRQRQALRFKTSLFKRISGGYDPCTENYAEKYFNRPDVQKALHANFTKIQYKWTACSERLLRNWNDSDFSVLPIYKELIANAAIRIWVYSGDVDSIVPVTATRFSLGHLRLPVKKRWYPWYSDDNQVGGWSEVYEGLTFATIRGAGHEVPLLRPRAAMELFRSFLSGEPLPSESSR